MSLYGRLFAAAYDSIMAGTEKAGLAARRGSLLAGASGRVLEIGGGTGANLPFYGPEVDEVVITEPEEPMARKLEAKLGASARPVRVVRARAEELPFERESFDFAVSTLVLCTVADPERSLGEIRRVLKPGGQLLFLEHVRADDERLARWQDRLHGPWFWFGHGCNCNRPTLETLEQAGFAISSLERARLPKAPPIVRPMILGAAAPLG